MNRAATLDSPGWPMLLTIAAVAGVGAGLAGAGALVAVPALLACAAVAARPREAAVVVGLASPLNNVAVLHVGGVFDLRFLQVLWLVILLSLLTRWSLGRPLRLAPPPGWFAVSLAVMVGWQAVSMLYNGAGTGSLVEVVQLAGYAVIAWLVAACFGVLPLLVKYRILLWAGVAGAVLLAASIAYFTFGLELPYTVEAGPGGIAFAPPTNTVQDASTGVTIVRMKAFNLSTVTTASVVACMLGLAMAATLLDDRQTRLLGRVLLLLSGAVLLLTFSRAGWLVGAFTLLAVAWKSSPKRAVAIAAAIAVLMALLMLVPQVSARFAEFSDPTEGSTSVHLTLWGTAVGFANSSPVFGGGPNSFVERTRTDFDEPAHNFVLEAAADTGWVGALIVLAVVGSVLAWTFRRLWGASPLEFAVWAGLAGAVLMNLTMNGFREDMWWVWMGMAMALASRRAPARLALVKGATG